MAYYSYYQQHSPTSWGTSGYEVGAPPAPLYQPQPSWTGGDYYLAHGGGGMEPSFFDNVWSKIKNFTGFGGGVSRTEAKYWHRRVYGGMVSVNTLLPSELGAAAGYEAIRLWEHHKTIYRQPLSDDRDREREALAGIAIAEAAKLWQIASHGRHGGRETSEVAAATAERIFNHQYDNDGYEPYGIYPPPHSMPQYEYDYHDGSHHGRRRSSSYYRPSSATQYVPLSSSAIAIPSHSPRHLTQYGYSPPSTSQYGGYPMSAPAYSQPPYMGHSPYSGGSALVPVSSGSVASSGHHRSRRNSFHSAASGYGGPSYGYL